jgi:L-asparaginase
MEITFITTGGTIDKDYPQKAKGYAFEITDPAIVRILKRINPNFSYNVIYLLKKDSLDITDEDREMILEACSSTDANKIILTHGTDAMVETAKKLQGLQGKTIILVGASRPERFSDSDAAFNAGTAIGAIDILENGVYIAMSGRIYPWDKCKRDPESGKFVEA